MTHTWKIELLSALFFMTSIRQNANTIVWANGFSFFYAMENLVLLNDKTKTCSRMWIVSFIAYAFYVFVSSLVCFGFGSSSWNVCFSTGARFCVKSEWRIHNCNVSLVFTDPTMIFCLFYSFHYISSRHVVV